MIKYLMFDFDGTLFHTAPGIHVAVNSLLTEMNRPTVDYDLTVSLIGEGLEGLSRKMRETFGEDLGETDQLVEDFRRHYQEVHIEHSALYEGVTDFLDTWPHKLAIVSNKSEVFLHELIAASALKHYPWEVIIGGDTFAHKKPHPLPIEEALRSAGIERQHALMIGDGLPDVGAAKAAGVQSVAVEFGYHPVEDLIKQGANYQLPHFKNLEELIRQIVETD